MSSSRGNGRVLACGGGPIGEKTTEWKGSSERTTEANESGGAAPARLWISLPDS
jgi:hypothetical protein